MALGVIRLLVVTACALGLMAAPVATEHASRAEALSGSEFKAGNIISDAAFFDPAAMSLPQIEAFLDSSGASCVAGEMPCLKDYVTSTAATPTEGGLCQGLGATSASTAGEVIYRVANACGISPKVMLVMLQKEQGLVTRSRPTLRSYQAATGFACPDTAPCDVQYYGFFNQVYRMARQFKVYTTNPTRYGYQKGRSNNILFNPNTACGSSPVYLENQATANLYIYTPYQPNAAALANLYGTGDACSAYGNRNFWRYYTDWFGSAVDPGIPMFTNTGGVPLRAQPNDTATVVATLLPGTAVGGFEPQTSGYYRVRYGSTAGYIKATWLSKNPTATDTLYTTTNAIPVYLGPGAGYHLAGFVNVDVAIGASSTVSNGYVNVVFGQTGGWINQAYLRTNPSGPLVVARTGMTNTGGVPVLGSPDPAAPVIATYPPASPVQAALGEYNGYVKVAHNGAAAWIAATWLTFPPAVTGSAMTNTNGIPVYLGPGAQYHLLAHANARLALQTGATSNGFTHVVWNGGGAWIEQRWLSRNPAPTGSAMTNTNGIPVLLGPGAGYEQIAVATASTAVPTAETTNGYVRVVWGTTGGWIDERWLSRNPAPAGSAMTNTNGIPVLLGPGAGYAIAGGIGEETVVTTGSTRTDGYVNVVFGQYGGWIDARWLAEQPTGTAVAYTTTSGVPLYRGPGAGYSRITELLIGTAVWTAEESNGYLHIVHGQYGAWIPKTWLSSSPTANPPAVGTALTNTNGVPVLASPSADGTALGQLPAGTPVAFGSTVVDGFVQVRYGSIGGWIKQSWLATNPVAVGTKRAITNGIAVYLGPGPGFPYLGEISAGTVVSVSAEEIDGYLHIVYGQYGAWVAAQWFA